MLNIKNLYCGYNSKIILEDISFKVEDKEFFGIIGPNGSGKTTLLRAITKVINIKGGDIIFEDSNINSLNNTQMAKKVAVVSQTYNAGFKITVRDFILLGRIPHLGKWQFIETKTDEDIVYEAMELTGIVELKERFVNSLSGGERQLVVIARALAQEPKLLLMDEPTNNLDIAHQIRVLDLVKRLNREKGLTVVMVLHDLNLASEYCDRLVLLKDGRVHKGGAPSEVLSYEIIEEVYKTAVVVGKNPASSKPCVFLVSKENIDKGVKS